MYDKKLKYSIFGTSTLIFHSDDDNSVRILIKKFQEFHENQKSHQNSKLLKTNKETLIKMEFFSVYITCLLKKLFLFVLERITL
jgi:hypothetical protein